jgi:hypothetical protein
MGNKEEWLALGGRLLVQCDLLLKTANISQKNQDETNQCTVALALLCRTVNNYAAARELLEKDFVVEARTLVRCCYENLFWIASLNTEGPKFIEQMIMADATHRIKRGNALLEWARASGGQSFESTLDAFLQKLESETPKKGDVNLFEAAKSGNIKAGYIIYRVLSTDAAHPSAVSLDRHLQYDDGENAQKLTFLGMPRVDNDEESETAEFAFGALLTVALLANKIVGGTEAGDALADLHTEFRSLSNRKAEGN